MRSCWKSTTAVSTAIVSGAKKRTDGYDQDEFAAVTGGAASSTSSSSLTVLEIKQLHCYGCAKKVRSVVSGYPGVTRVTMDIPANLVMVAGTFDAERLALLIRVRSKKEVTVISTPAPVAAAPPEVVVANVPYGAAAQEGEIIEL